jgi:hypothetical protein
MRRPLWQLLLTCLLLIALPTKGVVAAGMMACDSHDAAVASAVGVMASAASARESGHARDRHGRVVEAHAHDVVHAHVAQSAAGHGPGVAEAFGAAASPFDSVTTDCGHCAPCCTAVLATDRRIPDDERLRHLSGLSAADASYLSAEPRGLERPPRRPFA